MRQESAGASEAPLYGAIEGGGTKFVCAVGTGPGAILARTRIDTGAPQSTLDEVADFFERETGSLGRPLAAGGLACFGPLELDTSRPEYGQMLRTPKPGWSGAPLLAPLQRRLGVPVALDTDVNGAALAETRWGAAQGCDPALYLTVGTGIGGGAVVGGETLRGLLHPEMGHIPVPRQVWPDGSLDSFAGVCPFHGDCLEGLASGPALGKRLGAPLENAPAGHAIWDLAAAYLAHALATYTLVLMPRRIVIGGGVVQGPALLARIQARLRSVLNGYVVRSEITDSIEQYVVAPHFGQDAGLAGAFALAVAAHQGSVQEGTAERTVPGMPSHAP